MKQKQIHTILMVVISLLFWACSEETKEEYLVGEAQMIDILVEMHLADGMLSVQPFPYEEEHLRSENLYQNILSKRGLTRLQFDSALSQYTQNRTLYLKMYDKVIEKLKTKENEILSNANTNEEKERGYPLFQYSYYSNFDSYRAIENNKVKFITQEISFSAPCSYKTTKEQERSQSYSVTIPHPIRVLEIQIQSLIHWEVEPEKFPKIVFVLFDKNKNILAEKQYSTEILKSNPAKWKKINTKYQLGIPTSQKNTRLWVYFWNPTGNVFYLDDYSLKINQIK